MLETLELPFQPLTGFVSAAALFFALLIGHALADYPLQGDFLSRGKSRHVDIPELSGDGRPSGNVWIYLMTAHCLIHAGFVWMITGFFVFALAEFVLHWVIDVLKCEGKTTFAVDQWLHVICKLGYVVVMILA
jgi:hypothetical protein